MKKKLLALAFSIVTICISGCKKNTDIDYSNHELPHTHTYEVISVYQYMALRTNNFGAVIDQNLKYCFTYIGDDGQLHQFDDFKHSEYGLWKVCIGDSNKYVVVNGFDTYRYLYLTQETLSNIQTK